LWEKAGGRVEASRRWAADFELWVRFFRHAQVYPVDALIGGFRIHGDSLGLQAMEVCYRIHDEFIEAELNSFPAEKSIRLLRRIGRAVKPIPIVRGIWRRLVTNRLYYRPGEDWPPIIEYQWGKNKWGFRK
jgi:hypothetical protein